MTVDRMTDGSNIELPHVPWGKVGALLGLGMIGGGAVACEAKPTISQTSELTTITLSSSEYKPVTNLSTCEWAENTVGNKDPYNAFLSLPSENVETPFFSVGDLGKNAQKAIDLLDKSNPYSKEKIKTVNLLACTDEDNDPVSFPFYETESGKFLMGVWQPVNNEGTKFNLVLTQLFKGSAKGTDNREYLAYNIEDSIPIFTFNIPGQEVLSADFDAMTPEQQTEATAKEASFSPPEFLYDIVRQSKISFDLAFNSPEMLPTSTPAPVATETATATATKESSPTPEIEKVDIFDMSTWTPEMLGYFKGLGSNASKNSLLPLTDAQFDEKLTEAMRFGLLQRGITQIDVDGKTTDTKEANEQTLLWGYLTESAKEQKEVYLSKDMIIKIDTNSALENIPHWIGIDPKTKKVLAEYGLWAERYDNVLDITKINDPGAFSELQQFSVKVNVYGTEVSTPYFTSQTTYGDYAGFVRLPGATEKYASLTRIKDLAGHSYLKLNSTAIKDPVKFDPSMHTCLGVSDGLHEMSCPNYQVATKGVDYPASWESAKLWTKEEWLSRLNPKFNSIILKTPLVSGNDTERKHVANIRGFLDPDSGLEIVEMVAICSSSSSNSFQNNWPNPTS